MNGELARQGQWRQREDAGLHDLQSDDLASLLVALLVVAFLILLGTSAFIAQVGIAPAFSAFGLGALVIVAGFVLRRDVRLAASLIIIGSVVLIAASLTLLPVGLLASLLCVPVLVAVVMLGVGPAIALLVCGGSALTWIAVDLGRLGLFDALFLTFGVSGLILMCAALLWRSYYLVLDWSWTSYRDAQRHTATLRQRQAELGRLNQSLVLAYEQIKQTSVQLERARQAAEEARRLKADFAASVSHELRTPLNLIIGLTELMVEPPRVGAPTLPAEFQEDVEAIYRNACHISTLIDDVLDLSQIEVHQMGLLKEWTTPKVIVDQAAATVRTLYNNAGLSLHLDVSPDLPPVFVDPVRIRQIIINLLSNAVRFTEEGGVTVRAQFDAGQLLIQVTDTGVGIPAAELPNVFHEFWRPGEPRRGRRGSGLGLAVSKRFAELHGGNLWVTSAEDEGSTFCLALPDGEKAILQENDLAFSRWGRLTREVKLQPSLLLLDPDPEVVYALRRGLRGVRVATAGDGPLLERMLSELAPRALLADSPAKAALLRSIQERQEGERVPVLTCEFRTRQHLARKLGVQDYLIKPITQQQLRRSLQPLRRPIEKCVIADDDPEMQHLLSRMIGAQMPECSVYTASNGVDALALVRRRSPDLLFLDLAMPLLDGSGVLGQIRQDPSLAGTKVVVLTARGTEDDGLLAERLEVSQQGGLPMAALCQWLQAGLATTRLSPAALAQPVG